MKFEFTSSKWFLLLVAIILPLLLLVVAMALSANICIIMLLLGWLGAALLMVYMPKYED